MEKYREAFERHCVTRGFLWQSNLSVKTSNDKLLFNISGGVPFEAVIAGDESPNDFRIASLQRCIRTDSWKKIGYSGKHHIAFDMFGHFSLYELSEIECKRLMIETAWSFLVEEIGLPASQLHVTVHPLDAVCLSVWRSYGVRIDESEVNVGIDPRKKRSALRSEILWTRKGCVPLELWNLVFTQFEGARHFVCPLGTVSADSGISLDRLVSASENCPSNYENSLWKPIIDDIFSTLGDIPRVMICRLADMVKAALLIASCGIAPGNKASAYVLRKIIRELYLLAAEVHLDPVEVISISARYWLTKESQPAVNVLLAELAVFHQCLLRGEQECLKIIVRKGYLREEDFDFLATTFGYPRKLSERYRGGESN